MSEPADTLYKKKNTSPETVGGILVQSEKLGFESSELLACPKCERQNSPDRFECIYCGTELGRDSAKDEQSIDRTPPEIWENGFNLILYDVSGQDPDTAKVAKILGLEPEVLINILQAARPMPIMRARSKTTTDLIGKKLYDLGLRHTVIADSELRAVELPVRLRGLEFGEDRITLIDFNTTRRIEAGHTNIELIVTGKYFSTRTEISEKRQKKKESKVLSETETSSDQVVTDIYIRGNELGFRIFSTGFDFSCLGSEKGILAVDNMDKLTAKLRSINSGGYVDDYNENAGRLGNIWELESRKDLFGLQRTGFGRTAFESIATSNNLNQFTKFSRLNRILNEA